MKEKWSVLVRITIAVMENHGQKASWGGKSLLGLYLHITVYHWRKSGHKLKQDRNLEAGADTEVLEGCFLLAAPPDLFSLVFIEPRAISPAVVSQTVG